ncbi:MAG: M20/M25/M40 family metallo-hydrolase [Candidatus Dadabacteria bacterium]|nr:M20/M25/M40 family metallo-hydrolase [Candidatus Dadabacteria bacterium]NIQ15393.1 M20/M25/M40 family metallo-hydrolase [Candidatus Dadabacteria bacterium]
MKDKNQIKEDLVSLTKDLILIPGTSHRPADIDRCISFIKDYINDIDSIEINDFRQNGIPSFVALPKGVKVPDILLISHLDVISHADVSVYSPKVRNGRIYGPGSGDMKGALSIMLELFRNLHQKYPNISLGLAITSDEEDGGASGIGYLFDELGMRCGMAINPDGGSLNEITIAEKGVIHLKINCLGSASHAARPWLGDNALEHLIEKINDIKNHFSKKINLDNNWYPTCSLTMLRTLNETINRIPEVAEAILDIRFPPAYSVDKMLSEIKEVISDDDIVLEVLLSAEPVEFESDELFKQVITEITNKPVSLIKEDGASDTRYIHKHGIPVIISRPLVGELHTKDEWIDIESMIEFYEICKTYIERKLIKINH